MLLSLIVGSAAAAGDQCTVQHLEQSRTIEQMVHQDGWEPLEDGRTLGYTDHPVWIRCAVPATATYISVQNPIQKRFDVHFVSSNLELISTVPSGRTRPAVRQDVRSPDFNFRLPQGAVWAFIQDDSLGPKDYPIQFGDNVSIIERTATLATIHGLYYGALTLLVLYALVAGWFIRDSVYHWYAVYAVCLMLFLANADGFGRVTLWPGWGEFLNHWPILTLTGATVAFSQFAIRFLRAQKHHPQLTRALNVAQVLFVSVVVWRVSTDHYLAILLGPYVTIAVCALFLCIGALRARSGSRAGMIFLVGNGFMAAGVLTYFLQLIGLVPSSLLSSYAAHIGSLAEVLILSTALGLAAHQARRRNLEFRHKTLELSRRVRELQSAKQLAEEHRQLQRTLHNAQKQRTLGQMAGGISHEFNNILASILGFAELAQQRLSDRVQTTRYLSEIRTAGNRATELVRQLMQYSRGQPHRARDIDVVETSTEVCNLLRSSLPPTISLKLSVDPASPPERQLYADPQSVQQLLVNLCLNASEAMNDRGVIEVTIKQGDARDVLCASCMERFSGEHTIIEVTDNGPGISKNAHEIFEPFFTTKQVGSGSGLGLSVVHGIVHDCNGHIQVHNRAQGGLRVALYLKGAPREEAAAPPVRILLIEDSPSISSYLTTLLEEEDWRVVSTSKATEALERFVAEPSAFDLVITDEALPHGSGYEVAQDLLALRPGLPIIMTTHDPDAAANALPGQGVSAVFSKPIEAELLLAKIRSLLERTEAKT